MRRNQTPENGHLLRSTSIDKHRSINLLQVLRRTAHGFTNPRNFEARGILIT